MFNQYQPNIDNMQQYLNEENEKSNFNNDGPNWWNIPKGMSSIRILPPWDPTGRVALPVFMHPIQFQGQNMRYKKWNWTCVNKTFNKPCAICEGLAEMSAAGVDTSNWEANRRQFYFNVIVMHDPTYNQDKNEGTAPGTHAIMKAGKTVYDWVISQITNPMIGDITNIQNGIDVYITKEGEGLGTEYKMTLSPNGRTPVPQEYLDKIENLYNLDDIFSTGFEKEQTDELINHLKQSAGVMGGMINNAINQMGGYTQAPPQQNPTFPQGGLNYGQIQQTPPQFTAMNPPQGMPQIPSPAMQTPSPAPQQTPVQPVTQPSESQAQVPQAPTFNSGTDTNLPKCFGNYDAGNVSCVVCPCEIKCAQSNQ